MQANCSVPGLLDSVLERCYNWKLNNQPSIMCGGTNAKIHGPLATLKTHHKCGAPVRNISCGDSASGLVVCYPLLSADVECWQWTLGPGAALRGTAS